MLTAGRSAPARFEPLSRTGWKAPASALFSILLVMLCLPALAGPTVLDMTIMPSNPTVAEGSQLAVTVSSSGCLNPANDVIFLVTLESITAQPADYQPPMPNTFTFGLTGGFNQTILIDTVDDALVEADETFRIRVTPTPGQTLFCLEPGPLTPIEATAVATILDDDVPLPALSIGDFTLLEGDAGTVAANFLVVLTPASQGTVTVAYATADGTASAGSDYLPTQGTLTFQQGQATQTITVQVLGDTLVEPDESFFVDLSNPDGATLADGRGQGIIRNDDQEPSTLSIGDASVFEGDTGTTAADFTVTLAPASSQTVTVAFATADGTATAPSDYAAAQGTLTFAPGETTKAVTVQVQGDTEIEDDETFFIDLSNPTGASLEGGRGEGTIRNDDQTAPGLAISNSSVLEGDMGTVAAAFTVTLGPASAQTVTVAFATADGTATAPSDYAAISGTLTFAPGETTKTVTVQVNGDTEIENDETFFVDLSNPTGAALADGRGQGTIRNDDATQPTLSIGDTGVPEGDSGSQTATFVVTLSQPRSAPTTLSFTTADGTANAGSDYLAAAGTLTLAPGQTRGQIAVTVLGDTTFEPNEFFLVNLTGGSGVPIVDAQGRGTILNDDSAPQLQLERVGDEARGARPGEVVTLAVRVTSAGQPVADAPVTWEVDGDAVLLFASVTLSQPPDGIATMDVGVGQTAGQVDVRAFLPGGGTLAAFRISVASQFRALFTEGEAGQAVAGALEDGCADSDGAFGELCGYLRELGDPAAQRQAIEALVPDQVSAMGTVAVGSMSTQIRQLLNRMKRQRGRPAGGNGSGGNGSGGNDGGGGNGGGRREARINFLGLDVSATGKALLAPRNDQGRIDRAVAAALAPPAYAAAPPAERAAEAPPIELDSRWGLFVSGTISDGDRPLTSREQGFDFQTDGLTAGLDYAVNDRFSLGAAVGYLSTDSRYTDGGALTVDGYSLSGFASYSWTSFYLDAVASFGSNDYELARAVTLPMPFQGQTRFTAAGRPSGDQLALALALGGDHSFGATTLSGFGRLSYVDSTIDRYRESGAGALALEIQEQAIESLILEVGFELTWAASLSWGVLQPQLRGSFLRELEDDSRLLRARFVADRSFTDFVIPTDAPDREFFNAGAGFSAVFPHGWSCYLFYEQDFSREDLETRALSGGFRVEL